MFCVAPCGPCVSLTTVQSFSGEKSACGCRCQCTVAVKSHWHRPSSVSPTHGPWLRVLAGMPVQPCA